MKAKRKKIKNIILGVLAALAALAMALLPVILRASRPGETDAASVLNARTERGSIRTTISGGGALAAADPKKISLPQGVEIAEYLVKNGQSVSAGQPVAAVNKPSVMKTIAEVQKNLDYLDKKMGTAPAAQETATLTSPVAGRVKAVYIEPGSQVTEVMLSHGALMVISLDGRMAVDLETREDAAVGDEVTVILSDGRELPGRVERRQGDTLTVTLTDDGPALGETVSLRSADGKTLGEGELYIHSAWNMTATSGVVKSLYIKPEQTVYRGNGLCVLEQMDGNGRFDQLAGQRRDYEEVLTELFALYENGAVLAPEDGITAGIDTARLGLMRAGMEEYQLVFLAETGDDGQGGGESSTPDPNNPTNTQNKAAMVSAVSYGSITFLVDKEFRTFNSFAAATAPDYSNAEEKKIYSFGGAKIYSFDADSGNWNQVGSSGLNTLKVGDLVYLAYNDTDPEKLEMVLIPEPPEPEEPDYGGGGGGGYEPPFEMYDLTRREIMRLNPRGDMTVQVKIDEMDILGVSPGQEAEITVDALPGRSFTGRVREIDPKGVNSGGRTRYTVTITVDQEEDLLSGMNATAILTVGVTEDVLILPVAALSEKGGRTVVYTGYDPQTQELLLPVEVEIGISDGVNVEIVSGLAEGTQVFYTYYETAAMPELAALPGQLT